MNSFSDAVHAFNEWLELQFPNKTFDNKNLQLYREALWLAFLAGYNYAGNNKKA